MSIAVQSVLFICWFLLISVGIIIGTVQLFCNIQRFLNWISAPKNKNLNKYGANVENSWVVITGASSGIGENMAYQMCHSGFNIIIMARRKDCLQKVKERCEGLNPLCKVHIVIADLSKSYSIHASLMSDIEKVVGEQGQVRVLMHFAGNSDLAVHFTDKSVERNVELMRLVVESTLVLTQRFTEMMCRKSKGQRCAILTCGALTAYTPAPTFATSSANKHYVRALTAALAAEYEYIDFMIAHPIAVKSEIVKNSDRGSTVDSFIIDSEVFVSNIIADMGNNGVDLNGYWKHDIVVFILCEVLPLSWVQKVFYQQRVKHNSEFLGRSIDTRSILEKF
jgi:uncharacterized protein